MKCRLALALILVSKVASADEPAALPPPAAEPPPRPEPLEVRVIGGKPDSLQRIPGSGTMVTRQEIERAEPTDVAEMLRRVPGVQARQEYGGGQRLDISIRGLEGGRSRRVLVLEDGIPVALNPYAEPDMYYSPPVERMRGIEVVKGSGNILFGPQTIGGVVNFLTLAPTGDQTAAVDAEGGSLGYFRGLAKYGDSYGGVRYVAQAFHKRGDGFRDESFNSTDAMAKFAFDTSRKGELTFKIGFHDDAAQSDDVGLTRDMFAANPRQGTLAPLDHLHLRRFEVSMIHEHRFTAETKLKTLIYAYDTNRIWRRQNYARTSDPRATYDHTAGDTQLPGGGIYFLPTDTILDRDYQVAGVEPRLEHRLDTGGVGHTFDIGARLLGETAHYQQRSGDNPTSYSGSLDYEEQHRTIAFATYIQDRIAFRDWVLVTPGVRVEHAEYHRIVLRQNDGTGTHDVSNAGNSAVSGVIPGIGMIVGSRKAHIFGGMHVGWAPPRVTSSIGPKGTSADLKAEQSINYETGARLAPNKWLKVETTGFLSNFQNQVVLDTLPGAQTTETDGGTTRHVGVEAATVVGLGKLLDLPLIADVGARYTFARATFIGGRYDGNLLPYAPLHSFNANLDIEHPSGIGGQIAYSHVSWQFTDVANTIDVDATGRVGVLQSHNIVDVTAHYRHKKSGLSLRLTLKNALDDVYIVARRPEGIFASGFRQAIVGLRWDYEKKVNAD
jgi:Fe(3+) dicitrate transport protein